MSEYQQLVSIARRQGKTLPEIAAAWRHANTAVHGNPMGPESLERLTREVKTGRYLSEGVSFPRALALARARRNPARRVYTGSDGRASNPATNWTPILAIGAALAYFAWKQSGGGSSTTTTGTVSSASAAPATQGWLQMPATPALIPFQAWWSKYKNNGLGAPITAQFPDTMVYDTPDGGRIGLPIPPPVTGGSA